MKILGHTLGTPDFTVGEALRLFADVGCDGAELIWQDGYLSALPEGDLAAARRAMAVAEEVGLFIGCLTPYMTEINNPDLSIRQVDIDRFRRCIETAAQVGAERVRVYAGNFHPVHDADSRDAMWKHLVDSLATLGVFAEEHGVTLCVENHFNTMTESAQDTVDLMNELERANGCVGVGILYDQANLAMTHSEDYTDAVRLQAPWIRHVHVKNLVLNRDQPYLREHVFLDGDDSEPEEPIVKSRLINEGMLDWSAIIASLASISYEGGLSIEYEARWQPQDLPPSRDGIGHYVRGLRAILESGQGSAV